MFRRGMTRALLHVVERLKPGAGVAATRRALQQHIRTSGDTYAPARELLEDLAGAERTFVRLAERYLREVEQGRIRTTTDTDRYVNLLWKHYRHEIRPRRDQLIRLLRTI